MEAQYFPNLTFYESTCKFKMPMEEISLKFEYLSIAKNNQKLTKGVNHNLLKM